MLKRSAVKLSKCYRRLRPAVTRAAVCGQAVIRFVRSVVSSLQTPASRMVDLGRNSSSQYAHVINNRKSIKLLTVIDYSLLHN